MLHPALVPLGGFVVGNAYGQDIPGVVLESVGILFLFDLCDGGIHLLVVFQFDDDGGLGDIPAWNEHDVEEALAGREFLVDGATQLPNRSPVL